MRRAAFVFLSCLVLVVSRRPDVLFHAQFWAEDGKFWYADAYNLGALTPFLQPSVGYFQTLPRLAALIAQLFPLAMAPLILNCVGILIQILPVQFLLSSRCRELGNFAGRCLFAFFYLALPNSQEMHVNITNQQWRLAFLALLIVFSQPGRTALWNAFDFGILLLSGLSGPFAIFIAPVALVFFYVERSRWRLAVLMVTASGALTELLSLLIKGSDRILDAVRGATPALLVQILTKQVFLAVLLGRRTLGAYTFDSRLGLALAVAVAIGGIALELYVLVKAPLPWKAFIVFSTCILGVSLASPMTSSPQWPHLLDSGGVRYWFFSLLAFIASLVWLLEPKNPAHLRRFGTALLVLMMFGVIQDWGHPRPVDLQFKTYANQFSAAPAGTAFEIPLNPIGWTMELMKR